MNYLKLLALFLVGLVVFSCDEEDVQDFFEDPEIDVTTNFVIPLQIESGLLPDPTQRITFSKGGAYDIISNPQIAEEIGEPERIKKMVINSIMYEFRNFSGNVDAEVEGEIEFSLPEEDMAYAMPIVNAAESDLFETVYTLSGNFGSVNEHISNTKVIGFVYYGAATHNPVNFTLEVIVNATVTLQLNVEDL